MDMRAFEVLIKVMRGNSGRRWESAEQAGHMLKPSLPARETPIEEERASAVDSGTHVVLPLGCCNLHR